MRDLRDVDGRELAQALAKLAEARPDELLPLEGRLVLAVLPEIAHLHGSADLARQRDVELELQLLDFVSELGLECFDHESTGLRGGTKR